MLKKLINIVVFVPLGVLLIVLSVANRQTATLALNPFNPPTVCFRSRLRFSYFSFSPSLSVSCSAPP